MGNLNKIGPMGYVNMRILFVCTLFTFTILTMENTDTSEQLDATGNHFEGLKNHFHWLIFRYLTLSEQGIYSKLTKTLYHQFRTLFLLLRTHELLVGLSCQRILQTIERVNNLTDETLQRRASVLKEDMSGFNCYIQMLMKPESDYTPNERDIMVCVTKMKHDRKLMNGTKFNDQSSSYFYFIYNFQEHTIETKHKRDWPLPLSYYNFKVKVTMPLVIQYRINDEDHIDIFAEYQCFDMFRAERESMVMLFSTAEILSNIDSDYPGMSFGFKFEKHSNTITKVYMEYYPERRRILRATYAVNYDVLSRETGNVETMEIKSIITSNSLIETKRNKYMNK